MKLSSSLLPGIMKQFVIYYDPHEGGLMARHMDYPREGSVAEVFLLNDDIRNVLAREREKTDPFVWCHPKDLPFEADAYQEVQMTVFHELECNVLKIACINEHDGLKDLFYFYFPENFSAFRLGKASKALMPDHKSIIGLMLHNAISAIYRSSINDREVLRQVNGSTLSIIQKYKEAQDELRKMKSGSKQNLVDICRHLLDEISAGSSIHYSLSPAAIEKLGKFRGDIPGLRQILQNAVSFASALEFETYREEFRIDEYHIHLGLSSGGEKPMETSEMPSIRYARTIALLDKLEKASRSVVARELPLTGTNVGHACSKPISAPAISDSLRKHRNKIITLLGLYPDRWNLIRSEFRPLVNVLSAKPGNADEVEDRAV